MPLFLTRTPRPSSVAGSKDTTALSWPRLDSTVDPSHFSRTQELCLGERLAVFREVYQIVSMMDLREAAGLIL